MRRAIPVVLFLSASTAHAAETRVAGEKELVDESDEIRLSLPTEEDREAWEEPGLRVQLGFGAGAMPGSGAAATLVTTTARVNVRVRLNRWWSLGSTLAYDVSSGGFSALRWATLVEPQFHFTHELSLSLGLGYGGISGSRILGPDEFTTFGQLHDGDVGSRTVGDDEKLWRCEGGAWVSNARLSYLYVVGPLFATGPYAEVGAQWTRCKQTLGRIDNETGQQIATTQWWLNRGGTLGWWLAWR